MTSTQAKTGVEVERLPELPESKYEKGGFFSGELDENLYSETQLLAALAAERAEAVRMREENEKLMEILRSWKAAQDYTDQYSHLPDARDEISGAWESAMQARDAALSPSQGEKS